MSLRALHWGWEADVADDGLRLLLHYLGDQANDHGRIARFTVHEACRYLRCDGFELTRRLSALVDGGHIVGIDGPDSMGLYTDVRLAMEWKS